MVQRDCSAYPEEPTFFGNAKDKGFPSCRDQEYETLNVLNISASAQEFFQKFMEIFPQQDQPGIYELHHRYNNFLDPDSSSILERFCPVQELVQTESRSTGKPVDPIQILKTVLLRPGKNCENGRIRVLKQNRLGQRIPMIEKEPTDKIFEKTQRIPCAGFDPEPYARFRKTDACNNLIQLSQQLLKEIADSIRAEGSSPIHSDRLEADLQKIEEYVHPCIPQSFHRLKGKFSIRSTIHTRLSHRAEYSDNWSGVWSRKDGWDMLQQGIEIAVLDRSSRLLWSEALIHNLIHNLQWPVPHNRFAPKQVSDWQKRYIPLLSQSLEEYVISLTPDIETGRLAAKDIHHDYPSCCDFLKKYPHCRNTLLRNPHLLQMAVNASQAHSWVRSAWGYNSTHGKWYAHMSNGTLVRRITNNSREQNVHLMMQHLSCITESNQKSGSIDFRHWPKAKLQRLVAGLPVNNPRSITIPLERIFEEVVYNCSFTPFQPARKIIANLQITWEEVLELPLEFIPRDHFEWQILDAMYLRPETVQNKPEPRNMCRLLWPAFIQEIRDLSRDKRSVADLYAENTDDPYGFYNWSDLHPGAYPRKIEQEINSKLELLQRTTHETDEFAAAVSLITGSICRGAHFKFALYKEIQELHPEILLSGQRLSQISSLKRIEDIRNKFQIHAAALEQIEGIAPHWPKEIRKPSFEWRPALVEDHLSDCGTYRVFEKCSSTDLIRHGNTMSHCIGNYVGRCLQKENPCHVLCIEHVPSRREIATATVTEIVRITGSKARNTQKARSNFEILETGGYRTARVPSGIRQHFKQAVSKMKRNAEKDDYKILPAMELRQRVYEHYMKGRNKINPAQLVWKDLETWKVMRQIWSGLPEFPEYTETQITSRSR